MSSIIMGGEKSIMLLECDIMHVISKYFLEAVAIMFFIKTDHGSSF